MGLSTGPYAANILCSVFGRDEGGSEYTFSQQVLDSIITRYWNVLQGIGAGA